MRAIQAALLISSAWTLVAGGQLEAEESLVSVAPAVYGTRVVADTQYSETHAGPKAADGSLQPGEGCWYSRDQTELPCALTFELAQSEDVRRVMLVQAVWNGNMYHTRDFAVEVSADGTTWRPAAEGTLPDESLARAELDLGSLRTKWLRILVLTSYNSFQTCGLAEVEILVAGHPGFGRAQVELNGQPGPPASAAVCGLRLVAGDDGPQMAVVEQPSALFLALRQAESLSVTVPVEGGDGPARCRVEAALLEGDAATIRLSAGQGADERALSSAGARRVGLLVEAGAPIRRVRVEVTGSGSEVLVRLDGLQLSVGEREFAVPVQVAAHEYGAGAPPATPSLRPAIEGLLIEWDWRMQDGIATPRAPASYREALDLTFTRGDALLAGLRQKAASSLSPPSTELESLAGEWRALKREYRSLADEDDAVDEDRWEDLWRRVHWLRRRIALSNPLADVGPLLFVKRVPACFSHQLTQYYGRYARPGGGVFVLESPGQSMACRQLAAGSLPPGSFLHPEVSYGGDRVLFAYCEAETTPEDTIQGHKGRYYHLYEMAADGSGLRQLTEGPYDDFAPRYLPDGQILFVSTRRQGWHRCGNPGCETYTVTIAEADGSQPRSLSFHETQEWDPALLNDGRIVYTRWDYVDRYAVLYQQLWTMLPDGSQPTILYGNNTFNPVGIWEPRAIPGSDKVMATAGAHHAMTAGSIVLVDVAAGVDGLEPLTRLTPDAPFPESENDLAPHWRLRAPGIAPYTPVEQQRWPGHCYRSPYPLSETYFLAAYSFDRLIGEPQGNPANMFGIYLVDAFGNKELLYRDPNIAGLWPTPLRPRPRPRGIPLTRELGGPSAEGVFVVQNVHDSDPPLGDDRIARLRVIQVLPKSTPGIDRPPVGLARGAPGKQVLGTVPVEADGSAHFRAPAGVPLTFQALDERGLAVQVMRSLTYLQPGETVSCLGCHEPRDRAPTRQAIRALTRSPSSISPGPEGSKPFSYPRLVQPVLDQHCVKCHGDDRADGGVRLTGQPEGHYTVSYNALVSRVPFSDQTMIDPLSTPGRFGARGSALTKLLLEGHGDTRLSEAELERLVTWMDTNALFYGTFDPEDQARQLRGELIEGPTLE